MVMVQDHLSEEEADELLDQKVHVFASTQELRNFSNNFVNLAGD